MTGKEEITAEIERLKKELKDLPSGDYKNGVFYVLEEELTPFINSLPAEEASEDLDVEINFLKELTLEEFRTIVYYFANWQKEQLMKGLCYETKVYRDEEGDGIDTPIESWLALENNEITNLPNIGLKEGEKVKIIIVKEDEQ